MMLFVWTGFQPDYTDGLAFAVAETIEQARDMIVADVGFCPAVWGELSIHNLSTPVAFSVAGGG